MGRGYARKVLSETSMTVGWLSQNGALRPRRLEKINGPGTWQISPVPYELSYPLGWPANDHRYEDGIYVDVSRRSKGLVAIGFVVIKDNLILRRSTQSSGTETDFAEMEAVRMAAEGFAVTEIFSDYQQAVETYGVKYVPRSRNPAHTTARRMEYFVPRGLWRAACLKILDSRSTGGNCFKNHHPARGISSIPMDSGTRVPGVTP